MALFHSALTLTKIQHEDGVDTARRWLHLGIKNAHLKCDTFRVPCELHVAHFNHEQRGLNSDGDCTFVRDRCREQGIPFYSFSWSDEEDPLTTAEVPAEDLQLNASGEELSDNRSFSQDTARRWRRQKLKELLSSLVLAPKAKSEPDSRWGAILTAHHRDDADENILLKLLRGSHLTNIWSMNAVSDGFHLQMGRKKPSIGYFAKPMLNVRKNDVIEYLIFNSLTWREDDSNSSNKYKRNKVRNELMPLLRDIAGGENALRVRVFVRLFAYNLSGCSVLTE